MLNRPLRRCVVATFTIAAVLASRSHADEAKARITVSATVVRPCLVTTLSPGERRNDGDALTVDCGERVERMPGKASGSTRFRLCEAESKESWCVGVRERFPGYRVRMVRFD